MSSLFKGCKPSEPRLPQCRGPNDRRIAARYEDRSHTQQETEGHYAVLTVAGPPAHGAEDLEPASLVVASASEHLRSPGESKCRRGAAGRCANGQSAEGNGLRADLVRAWLSMTRKVPRQPSGRSRGHSTSTSPVFIVAFISLRSSSMGEIRRLFPLFFQSHSRSEWYIDLVLTY